MSANWRHGCDVVVEVNGSCFRVGSASGWNMNCLIDTLRQVVHGGVDCNVQDVRNHIANELRDVVPGAFLDLEEHWRAVIKWLARCNTNGVFFEPDDFKIVTRACHLKARSKAAVGVNITKVVATGARVVAF